MAAGSAQARSTAKSRAATRRVGAGDDVRIPIQILNTTGAPIAPQLDVSADGGKVSGAGGAVTIPGNASRIEYVRLRVERAGKAMIRVALGDTDAVEKAIEVIPAGRPVSVTRTGTLAAPRALAIDGAAGSDPAAERIRP